MAGADADHPSLGALVRGDVTGADDKIDVVEVPGGHGALRLVVARRDYACARSADGQAFGFVFRNRALTYRRLSSEDARSCRLG
jgi:hypothetical protein